MQNIKVNMEDQFSGCTCSKELSVTPEKLAKFEQLQINGSIINQYENGINYEWVIVEVELLN